MNDRLTALRMANDVYRGSGAASATVIAAARDFLAFLEDWKQPEQAKAEPFSAIEGGRLYSLRMRLAALRAAFDRNQDLDLDALEAAIRRVEIVLRGQPKEGTDEAEAAAVDRGVRWREQLEEQTINAKQDTAPSERPITRLENAVAWALCLASHENYQVPPPGSWDDVGNHNKASLVRAARAALGEIAKEFMP